MNTKGPTTIITQRVHRQRLGVARLAAYAYPIECASNLGFYRNLTMLTHWPLANLVPDLKDLHDNIFANSYLSDMKDRCSATYSKP